MIPAEENRWDAREYYRKLQAGQVAVLDSLDQVQLVVRSFQEAKAKLRQLQERLLAHWSLQNDVFYDRLKAQYKGAHQEEKNIEFLVEDLKEMKVRSLVFFDDFPVHDYQTRAVQFPVKFAAFAQAVTVRLKLEEQYLLPLLRQTEQGFV